MSQQIQITGGAKVRNLEGVLTGTAGVVNSLGINVPSGIPQLDGSGKILVSQLPNSVMEFKGTWNAATNTPTLVNGTGNAGDVYLCNVAGTVNFGAGPITFAIGDQVLYSGTTWERASGATGTVTSVAVTESGDALTITGSPITTSGTINIGFAGTSGQYVNGAGGLTTFPSLTGFVPYTGATTNVNLGEFGLTSGYLGLDITPTSTPTAQGTMYWNADKESVDVIMNGVTGSVMQDTFFNVKNQTGASIPKGTVVRANGTLGASGRILIAPFLADGTYDSKVCLGVTAETIANGEDGKVTAFGAIRQIDTSAFPNGTILYASPSVAGAFTSTEPTNPNNIVTVAIVIYSDNTNGEVFVRPTFVDNAADITAALGYTPQAQLNGTGLVKASGTTISYDNSTYVTTDTTQTISGAKIFSSIIYANGNVYLPAAGTASTTKLENISTVGVVNFGANSLGFNSNDNLHISSNSKGYAVFAFNNSGTGYTYTLPATTGTIALTSQLTGGTVTSVGLSSSTSGVTIGSSPITTSGTITLSIATASGLQQGLLSSSDWTTFSSKQPALSGTGFVKISGSTISYDNSTYLTTSAASSTYLPLSGGTLSGALNGTSAVFSSSVQASAFRLTGMTAGSGALYWSSDRVTLANYNASGVVHIEANGGTGVATFGGATYNNDFVGTGRFTGALSGTSATFSSSVTATTGTTGASIRLTGLTNYGLIQDVNSVNRIWFENTGDYRTIFDLPSSSTGFVFRDNSGNIRTIITSGGNVGIGTSSPSGALHILGSSYASSRIYLQRTSGAVGTYSMGVQNENNAFGIVDEGQGNLTRFYINGSGNVGIGTSSPRFVATNRTTLDINGTSTSLLALSVGGADKSYLFQNGDNFALNNVVGNIAITTEAASIITLATSNTERMRITSGGDVYINKTGDTPATLANGSLQVNAEIMSVGSYSGIFWENRNGGVTASSNWGGWYWVGSVTYLFNGSGNAASMNMDTGVYTALSDVNKKKDFEASTIGLKEVIQLKPTLYRMKTDETNGNKELGFIAQEVKDFIPQAFVQSEDFIGLNYNAIVAALVKSVQELKAEIDELKNK